MYVKPPERDLRPASEEIKKQKKQKITNIKRPVSEISHITQGCTQYTGRGFFVHVAIIENYAVGGPQL